MPQDYAVRHSLQVLCHNPMPTEQECSNSTNMSVVKLFCTRDRWVGSILINYIMDSVFAIKLYLIEKKIIIRKI